MSLADLVIERRPIEMSGRTVFEVRGLSLSDIVALLRDHEEQIKGALLGGEDVDFVRLMGDAPAFVAQMIALAADEPGGQMAASQLPFGVQLEAVTALWELTSVSGEDLGNVLSALTRGAHQVSTAAAAVSPAAGKASNESVRERAARLLPGVTTPLSSPVSPSEPSSGTTERSGATGTND